MTGTCPPERPRRAIVALVEIGDNETDEAALVRLRALLPAARLVLSTIPPNLKRASVTPDDIGTDDARHALQPEPILALTPRRRDILRLLDQGLSNKQIALSLGISPFTVRNHVVIIMGALGVTTRARALENVRARGWLNEPTKRDQ